MCHCPVYHFLPFANRSHGHCACQCSDAQVKWATGCIQEGAAVVPPIALSLGVLPVLLPSGRCGYPVRLSNDVWRQCRCSGAAGLGNGAGLAGIASLNASGWWRCGPRSRASAHAWEVLTSRSGGCEKLNQGCSHAVADKAWVAALPPGSELRPSG